jgi:preprotein translocase subunit SecA
MLSKEGIPHNVLNAKFHEKEAEIVAEAGRHGAVTIATNMAGRGTDIKIDEDARAAGGLKIIGTERHESRRIDNQLRGRSGRQGDVGESKFYISLEDDLMRLFGSDRLITTFNNLGVADGEEIQHKMLSDAIERAQRKIESNNFAIRKNLLEYDQVMNEQRELVYAQRRRVLEGEDMKNQILDMIRTKIDELVDVCVSDATKRDEWDEAELTRVILPVIPLAPITEDRISDVKTIAELKEKLTDEALKLYDAKEKEFPDAESFREVERIILLRVIDRKWMEEIDDMDQLRQGIGLQAYGQRNPVDEYKMASYDMVDAMNEAIRTDTITMLYRIRIEKKIEREEQAKVTGTNKDETAPSGPKTRKAPKIYPNDPCPCGSGKKYKNCCGAK